MFRRKTVIVVGAGSGVDIEMPVGSELSNTIADKLNITFSDGHQKSGDQTIANALRRIAKDRSENANEWFSAARSVAAGIRYTRSIDAYLNTHRDNARLNIAGKLAIAQSILEAERRSAVHIDESESREWNNSDKVFGSWLPKLFFILQEGIVANENFDELFKNICVINFNYDRCVEHFLLKAITDLYGKQQEATIKAVAQLKIYHPYGSVGSLVGGRRRPVGFGVADYGDLVGVSREINTFNEKLEESEELNEMREQISEAQQIVFLGFHFHSQNMALLRASGPSRGGIVHVYATAVDRSEADKQIIDGDIRAMLAPRGGSWAVFVERTLDCQRLLRDYTSTLLR
jgi:hypothetical protein